MNKYTLQIQIYSAKPLAFRRIIETIKRAAPEEITIRFEYTVEGFEDIDP